MIAPVLEAALEGASVSVKEIESRTRNHSPLEGSGFPRGKPDDEVRAKARKRVGGGCFYFELTPHASAFAQSARLLSGYPRRKTRRGFAERGREIPLQLCAISVAVALLKHRAAEKVPTAFPVGASSSRPRAG